MHNVECDVLFFLSSHSTTTSMEDEWAAMDAGENLAIANVPTREFSYTPGIEIGERSVPAGMHDSSDMVGDFDFILIGLVTWISTNFFPFRRGKKNQLQNRDRKRHPGGVHPRGHPSGQPRGHQSEPRTSVTLRTK